MVAFGEGGVVGFALWSDPFVLARTPVPRRLLGPAIRTILA